MAPHAPLWTLATEQVYATLGTAAEGLSETETAHRIKQYGFNELPAPAQRSLLVRFTDQLTHFMALLLWVAGTLAFISGTPALGWAIWAVIWINAGFSFWQEFQAEQALAALSKLLPAQAKVYREGVLRELPVREIVPGDVMQLEEGDRIAATELAHIFDKFYRIPNADPWKQGGTGLGLAFVQKQMEHLSGMITVESLPEQLHFTVVLPLVALP